MLSREQLIADWRKRLASASDATDGLPARTEWLARLRVRLYRFLLSIYGDGTWNAPEASAEIPHQPSDPASSSSQTWAGKPAKNRETIRDVLSNVTSAQDYVCRRGPLTRGLRPNSWVVAAAASASIDTQACQRLLTSHGILARQTRTGDDDRVEVFASERDAAFAIIARNYDRLHASSPRKVTTRIPVGFQAAAVSLILLTSTIPVAWMLAAVLAASALPLQWNVVLTDFLFTEDFFRLWRGSFIIALLLIVLRVHRARRAGRRKKKDASGT